MSTKVDLPNGESATLRDSEDLTNREVKNLRKSARIASAIALKLKKLGFNEDDPETWTIASELTDEDDETLDLFQRNCVIMRLQGWTLDRPLPTNVDEVDDLPRPIFVKLTVAAADINFSDDINEPSPDPKVPTAD